MKKRILSILFGGALLVFLFGAVWLIQRRERSVLMPKEMFIPHNSAVVFQINNNMVWPEQVAEVFADELAAYQKSISYVMAEHLCKESLIDTAAIVVAFRIEGKEKLRSLYILNRNISLSRNDIHACITKAFPEENIREKRFNGYLIHSLLQHEKEFFYVVAGEMVLLSDSGIYIEDALKQLDVGEEEGETPHFARVKSHFSGSAALNIYLNTSFFTEIMPQWIRPGAVSAKLDLSRWFKWGALDAEFGEEGVRLDGLMYTPGGVHSFPEVLGRQQPGESRLVQVLPENAVAVRILRLSHVKNYLTDLEKHRFNTGIINGVRERKQEYVKMFGANMEANWQEIWEGEIGKGVLGYDVAQKEEEGVMVVLLKAGGLGEAYIQEMLQQYARSSKTDPASLVHTYNLDKEKQLTYYTLPAEDFCCVMWGYIFDGMPCRYFMVQDNYLILASSQQAIRQFSRDYVRRSGVNGTEWYRKVSEKLASKYNWLQAAEVPSMLPYYEQAAGKKWRAWLKGNKEKLTSFSVAGMQWINEGEKIYQSAFVCTEKVAGKRPQAMWQTKLDGGAVMKPAIVVNHNTRERELMVQDELNQLYLINDVGRILWKVPLQGRINSEIYQVDVYKNGKLQYLFSTPTHLYLIDRNGEMLPRYPLQLRSLCDVGITLYDYDNKKEYRIFAPGVDQQLYLYELSGNMVKGWGMPKSDNTIVSKLYHYRVQDKDYLVYADKYRVYILDRRGNPRVKTNHLYALNDATPLYLSRMGGRQVITFLDANGEVQWIDLAGKRGSWKDEKIVGTACLNVGDVTGDGADEWIFTQGEQLLVYNAQGKLLTEKSREGAGLGYPYIYRFAARDIWIGVLDEKQQNMLLTNLEGDFPGFPVQGTTPFSIAFMRQGEAGFYLFAGSGEGQLLKYRVGK